MHVVEEVRVRRPDRIRFALETDESGRPGADEVPRKRIHELERGIRCCRDLCKYRHQHRLPFLRWNMRLHHIEAAPEGRRPRGGRWGWLRRCAGRQAALLRPLGCDLPPLRPKHNEYCGQRPKEVQYVVLVIQGDDAERIGDAEKKCSDQQADHERIGCLQAN